MSAAEYDETTWSARTWLTFAMQRVSVAVHKAVAREVRHAFACRCRNRRTKYS